MSWPNTRFVSADRPKPTLVIEAKYQIADCIGCMLAFLAIHIGKVSTSTNKIASGMPPPTK